MVQRCWLDGNGLLLLFLIVHIVEAVFVEETLTLAIDGHCLPDDLVDVGQRILSVPLTESHQDVDT